MNEDRAERAPLEAIRRVLTDLLHRHFQRRQKVERLTRRRSSYSSSYSIENLHVALEGGTKLRMVLKDLSPGTTQAFGRNVRPIGLFRPQREMAVYDQLLHVGLATPLYYGSVDSPNARRYWLFLERVEGAPLWQFGRPEPWLEAARWLGRFHSEFEPRQTPLHDVGRLHLIRYDARFFHRWLARAEDFVRRQSGSLPATDLVRFGRLVDRYELVIKRLAGLPSTVIHGEFYASNVLVRKQAQPRRPCHGQAKAQASGAGADRVCSPPSPYRNRICPIDWEVTGLGPGLLDVAALVAGRWSEERRRAMVSAYHEAFEPSSGRSWNLRELSESVDFARLQAAIQWLGWAEVWSPPQEHAQDWLQEAIQLARDLGVA